ncbi:MAG: DUF3048 domain-containing protein [Patescibacteria group bacterium]
MNEINNLKPTESSINSHEFTSPVITTSPKKKLFVWGGITLVILALSVAAYFFIINSSISIDSSVKDVVNNVGKPADPRTIMNPITGIMYTPEQASSWIDIRPLSVMINNFIDARPQSGISKADIVYEIVAEGGITRFLAFYLSETPEKIGPIRSSRHYYLTYVKELGDAMYMHIGYSPQALEAIDTLKIRSLGRGNAPFYRDNPRNVASEHTAYANGNTLREHGYGLGWEGKRDFEPWKFKDDAPVDISNPQIDTCSITKAFCKPLTIDFWYEGDYTAFFKYNPSTNSYLRFTGYDLNGDPVTHVDELTNTQVEVKNVIVQFADEEAILGDDKNRLDYTLIGSGSGIVFMDGSAFNVTWLKEDLDSRTRYYDENGEEVMFNRGKIWVSIVPSRNTAQVVY